MLIKLGISSEEASKVQLRTVWPNLPSKEPCQKCTAGAHERFQPKPQECLPPGASQAPQYEPPGWHLFKEKLELSQFEEVLKNMTSNNEIEAEAWTKMLMLHTRLSCGVLYDEAEQTFFILGPDQKDLEASAEHYIMEPKLIEGLAGTGKTFTIAAKIVSLVQEGKICSARKCVYICYSPQMVDHITLLLTKRNVDTSNIMIVNAKENKKFKSLGCRGSPV